ncbi:Protein priB [Rhodotorula toruloides]|nr:Protein priB [Rhodotorula toruloides]
MSNSVSYSVSLPSSSPIASTSSAGTMLSQPSEATTAGVVVGQQAAQQLRAALARVAELSEAEEGTVAARALRRKTAAAAKGEVVEKTYTKACAACRKAKNRCLSQSNTTVCPRCVQLGLKCQYPETRNRGPKRRLSKTQRALRDIRRNIEAVLAGSATLDPLDEEDDPDSAGESDLQGVDGATSLLRNPLALLASQAQARLDAPRPADRTSDIDSSESYFDGGLYVARPEHDFSLDPIACGILTIDDLDRLLKLYFEHLFPFLYLLLPDLHTVDFLRLTSPFLTTCIAFVASTYDSLSGHLTPLLERQALSLAVRIFEEGLKSIEIVQGFFVLSHWASPSRAWVDDRAFQFLGQAWRIAAELRINLPLDPSSLASYNLGKPLTNEMYALFVRNRRLTWSLLFCGELAICVQTGRIDMIRTPPVPTHNSSPTHLPFELPNYHYAANLHVNAIFSKSISLANGLREDGDSADGLRASFMAFWKPAMKAWRTRWPDVNPFIDIHAENNIILLNLVSLRFRGGSKDAVLEDCKRAAIRTIQKVSSWEDSVTQLPYCSNFVVVNIAYGAILLLQLALRLDHGVTPSHREKILRVASILQQIGQSRPNAISVATLHAERILRLVNSLDSSDSTSVVEQQPPSQPAVDGTKCPSFYTGLHPPVWPIAAKSAPPSNAPIQQVAIDDEGLASPSAATVSDLTAAYSWLFPPSGEFAPPFPSSSHPSYDPTAPFPSLTAPTTADPFSLPPQTDFLDMTAHDPMMGWLWGGAAGVGGTSGTEGMEAQLAALLGEVGQL